MIVKPKEARQARAFLQKKGIPSRVIPPKLFAITAKRENKTFSELLKLISRLMLGGQGQGQAPEGTKLAEKEMK